MTLSQQHTDHLHASAIDDIIIAERGYTTIAGRLEWEQATNGAQLARGVHYDGLAFPAFRLGQSIHAWVFRPDQPRTRKSEPIKYEWSPGVTNTLDVLPRYAAALGDPKVPIWLTEGAKKADALASAYSAAIVPINLNGVWGWRCTNLAGGKIALPEIDEIAWNGRTVVLAFDSDVIRKPQVMAALKRFAQLLVGRQVVEVKVLILPDTPGGKTGVDDFLAANHTTTDLESHLLDLQTAQGLGRVRLCPHPETGQDLYLPPGYLSNDIAPVIIKLDPRGNPSTVYPDLLLVTELGQDLETHEQTMTVRWRRQGGHSEVTAPRKELVSGKGARELLAAAGAIVHETNQKYVAEYMSLFAHENEGALPHRAVLNRVGLLEPGLMLPSGAIGFTEPVRYAGRMTIHVGTSCTAYTRVLQDAATWPQAQAFWLIVALALASPAIARLRLRRNPAVYTAGPSGCGKTTVNQFAVGAFGDPTRRPFLVQANDATPVALSQTISFLRGLPLFVDEAHTTPKPTDLEKLAYRFANGEERLLGSLDRQTRGGESIGGTLLMAGEAMPEFRHAGSVRRILWVDNSHWPPLGQGTIGQSGTRMHTLGQQRAELLQAGWEGSAGVFAKALCEVIWRDWARFEADYQTMRQDHALAPLQAWREPLAAAAVTLNVACQITHIGTLADVDSLLDDWAAILSSGHEDSDPAIDAWNRLVTMLAQAEEYSPSQYANWITLQDRGQMLACRQANTDDAWRVLTNTRQFEDRVGAQAPQLYGRAWVERGWVRPGPDGKSTMPVKTFGNKQVRALVIPLKAIEDW